ncbi:MAG: copper chaperone PCu(A)C [Gemmatimonadaceae bacterium]|nr:copper chaperone PCu(A)C [Gemmatimonadaceae bacterium]MCW5827116.1 copper chaperone PCu(A)C [Gemmatimonadaceae bacterium]
MKHWRKTSASSSSRASTITALAAATLLGAACARDAAVRPSALDVREAWARTADSGAMTAVYFTLGNGGAESDTLVGVESTVAERTEMHISTQHGGMMRMSAVTSLPVPADDSVMFQPLGAHVMLTGLNRPLVEGDSLSITLRFTSGQTVEVRAGVRKP